MLSEVYARIFKRKPLTGKILADLAGCILNGQDHGLDVDSYEHANPKEIQLKDLHLDTLRFGPPEGWIKLSDTEKGKLRGIIDQMREFDSSQP